MRKPSVTELLDLLAKPALISWANKKGLAGIDVGILSNEKRRSGSSIHRQIELASFDSADDAIAFADFMDGKYIKATEIPIETEYFVGRIDALLYINGEQWVVDWKRGHKGKLYLENKLQLIAYTMAIPARMAIVGVPKFLMTEFKTENRAIYEDALIALSKLCLIIEEIKNDKIASL